ncbi:MAG TPA: FtsX-like permease family protein [Bacillota bacterium]|nr:FtsX-like permease family protein [Bacillota bacterium]
MNKHHWRQMTSIFALTFKNMKRWRWRLGLMTLLVAGSMCITILYGGMLQSNAASGKYYTKSLNLPYNVMVILAENQTPKMTGFNAIGSYTVVTDYGSSRGKSSSINITLDACELATAFTGRSQYGEWGILGIDPKTEIFVFDEAQIEGACLSKSGDLLLPEEIATKYDLGLGDTIGITAFSPYQTKITRDFTVKGIFATDYDLQMPLILQSDVTGLTGQKQANREFLLSKNFGKLTNYALFLIRMETMFPGAAFIYQQLPMVQSEILMSAILSPGQWLLLLVLLFLGVGILTISLMTFLERKQELAVIKSMGISNFQLTTVLFLEQALAGFTGFVIGISLVLSSTHVSDLLSGLSARSLRVLIQKNGALTTLVFMLSVLYPILVARRATVNQLLYARDIPLIISHYDHLINPTPEALEREQTENVHLLRLEVADGKTVVAILKNPGEHVKKGEVVAMQNSLFGFRYQEWLSPCDGTIESYHPANGYYAVKPDDPNAPHYPYNNLILLTAQQRERRARETKKQIK